MREYKERVKNLRKRRQSSLRNLDGDGENKERNEVEEKKMEGVRFKGAGRKSHRQGRKILMIYVLSWKNGKRM